MGRYGGRSKTEIPKVISKHDEDPNFLLGMLRTDRTSGSLRRQKADSEARQQMPSVIIRSPKLSERFAKKGLKGEAERQGQGLASLDLAADPSGGSVMRISRRPSSAGLLGLSSDDIAADLRIFDNVEFDARLRI
jgi:hypothetical protein